MATICRPGYRRLSAAAPARGRDRRFCSTCPYRAGKDYERPLVGSERSASMREVLSREREFHDAFSGTFSAADMPPGEPDELDLRLFDRVGDITGRRVLELGCGVGDLTLQLLSRGALVTALDLSEGMVSITRQRIDRFATRAATLLVAPVENCGLET